MALIHDSLPTGRTAPAPGRYSFVASVAFNNRREAEPKIEGVSELYASQVEAEARDGEGGPFLYRPLDEVRFASGEGDIPALADLMAAEPAFAAAYLAFGVELEAVLTKYHPALAGGSPAPPWGA